MSSNHRFIVRTYDVVTPESAEQGDNAEYGWADFSGNRFPIQDADRHHEENIRPDLSDIGHDCEPDASDTEEGLTAVDLAIRFLQEDCCVSEPSSTCFHFGVWYSAEPETDYEDGSDVSYSYHVHGFTEDEQRGIYARLFPRRRGRHQEAVCAN